MLSTLQKCYAQSQIFFKPERWKCLTKTCTRSLKRIHWCMKLPCWPDFLDRKKSWEDQDVVNTDLTKLHLSECFQSQLSSSSWCDSKTSCTHTQRSHLSSKFVYMKPLVLPWQTWAPRFVRTHPVTVVWCGSLEYTCICKALSSLTHTLHQFLEKHKTLSWPAVLKLGIALCLKIFQVSCLGLP